ncbi:MAG TPA: VWA domain-containing protein, partial [Gemmataceae bacterium]|nr:VWA domain-containing protein [Gemmataceae bacterium]
EEETNLRCTLVVDVSNSMHSGGGPLNKYNYACTVAACLGYLLLRQQDAVGCITFDQDVRNIVPPRSQQIHIDAITKAMDVSRPREKTDITKILRRVTESIPSRGMIVLVSDLLVDREPLFKGLEMLCQRRHDILIFHVLDEDEMLFPFAGTTRFEGMEELPHLLCDPRALRAGYIEALEEYLVEVRRGSARQGIDYALVRTGDYLDAVLSKFLHHRMALKSSAKSRTGIGQP